MAAAQETANHDIVLLQQAVVRLGEKNADGKWFVSLIATTIQAYNLGAPLTPLPPPHSLGSVWQAV